MDLYPAVDVQGGRVARAPGPAAADPLALAGALAASGARWLHFVDLDAALGRGDNRELARRFLAAAPVPVQVGGNLGSAGAIDDALTWGARRAVIGSAAATDADLVEQLLARHGADRLAVGIDAREGRVAPRGSSTTFDVTPVALGRRVHAQGARTVVYTDAARDGALAGPDVAGAAALAALGLDVIAGGGVASLDDLRALRTAGVAGAIVGRALHDGRFTLAEALACAAG
jgi:phosphoribosylformimino-5-aminoimidazole carboxamide ribonucleotide (ProFAR) isomerase